MIIKIKNLRLKTVIGVYEWEEAVNREIIVNSKIFTSFDKALKSDELSDAIDYDHLVTKIKNLVASKRYKLIEKMAQDMMEVILEDKRIAKCKLEIDKVGAVEALDSFSITIEQENNNG